MTSGSRRFFFVHLQKTGGTALFQRLREAFGPDAVYPTPDDEPGARPVIDAAYLAERLRTHGDGLQVITGHFPLCLVEVLGEPFTTFTVLRDPVERTLSLLRRRKAAEARYQDLELDEIYDDPALLDIIRNHMVKMLSLRPDEMTDAPLTAPVDFDDERLVRAQHNLEHGIDLFGLQEQFEEFCTELSGLLGRDLGAARFANRTQPRPVSEELRARIAADNHLDVELYGFAQRLYRERRERAPSRG